MSRVPAVQYVARNSAHEHVHVGSHVPSGKCARLSRFGRAIATFVITPDQEKKLAKGGRIQITDKAIQRAQLWTCTKVDGGLAAPRRKRRR